MLRFFSGLTTGLIISYLTASRSGQQTRDQLAKAATYQARKLTNELIKTTAQLSQLARTAKSGSGLF